MRKLTCKRLKHTSSTLSSGMESYLYVVVLALTKMFFGAVRKQKQNGANHNGFLFSNVLN